MGEEARGNRSGVNGGAITRMQFILKVTINMGQMVFGRRYRILKGCSAVHGWGQCSVAQGNHSVYPYHGAWLRSCTLYRARNLFQDS